MGQINSRRIQSDNHPNLTKNEHNKNITPRQKRSTPRGGYYLKRMLEDQEKRRKDQERKRKLMEKCGGCLSCFVI